MKTLAILVATLFPLLCLAQEVHISPEKNGVLLAVPAQRPYELMPGQQKMPLLGVECVSKGKKNSHTPLFSPGDSLVQEDVEPGSTGGQVIAMTLDGTKQVMSWAPYKTPMTLMFTYPASEAQRMELIQAMLRSSPLYVEFKPFLTGQPTTSVFDLAPLKAEMAKHPECAAQ